MKTVRGELGGPRLLPGGEEAVATVGTFDGVHIGHQEVLAEIVRRARASGRRSVLITFEPHPLRIVRPEAAPPLLTTAEEKESLIGQSGLDFLLILPFTPTLQAYPARRFVTEILLGCVGVRELVMGYDHGFGRGREGSVDTLRELGAELGFAVDVVEPVLVEGAPVSSTRVRTALADGDVTGAARLLGRPYSLQGRVVSGDRRGRELGFPTANLRIDDAEKLLPREGIYAAYGIVEGDRVPGLLHLGPRPTFAGASSTVELYLLDWSGDLYGKEVRVEVVERLRDVAAFDSVEALVEQMQLDVELGRAVFDRDLSS